LKKKKTCVKCGVEFDKTERERVKLLENFVRGGKRG